MSVFELTLLFMGVCVVGCGLLVAYVCKLMESGHKENYPNRGGGSDPADKTRPRDLGW